MSSKLLCKLGLHSPDRRKVAWDGAYYCAHCQWCTRNLIRIRRRTWRSAPSVQTAKLQKPKTERGERTLWISGIAIFGCYIAYQYGVVDALDGWLKSLAKSY